MWSDLIAENARRIDSRVGSDTLYRVLRALKVRRLLTDARRHSRRTAIAGA